MHTRNMIIAIGSALTLVATQAYANNISAQSFVTKASIANQFEIETSELALKKAQSSKVKSFAQRMVTDHSKTGDKLKEVLNNSESKIAVADGLDDKHQALLDKLAATSEEAFDNQYIAIQTDAHKEAVSLFSKYAKNGKHQALKQFATETLPTLKEHLEHVKQINANH